MSSLHRNDPRDLSPSWPLMFVIPLFLSATFGLTAPFAFAILGAVVVGEWWSKNIRDRFGPESSPRVGTIGSVGAAAAAIVGIHQIITTSGRETGRWPVSSAEWTFAFLAISSALICVYFEFRRFTRNGQPKPAVENDS